MRDEDDDDWKTLLLQADLTEIEQSQDLELERYEQYRQLLRVSSEAAEKGDKEAAWAYRVMQRLVLIGIDVASGTGGKVSIDKFNLCTWILSGRKRTLKTDLN